MLIQLSMKFLLCIVSEMELSRCRSRNEDNNKSTIRYTTYLSIYDVSFDLMEKILQHFVILLTAASIIMGVSTVAVFIPQVAYASTDEASSSSSSSSKDAEDCRSDELPAMIDGTIRCMDPGECYSSEFEFRGEKVKHCNFMTNSDE